MCIIKSFEISQNLLQSLLNDSWQTLVFLFCQNSCFHLQPFVQSESCSFFHFNHQNTFSKARCKFQLQLLKCSLPKSKLLCLALLLELKQFPRALSLPKLARCFSFLCKSTRPKCPAKSWKTSCFPLAMCNCKASIQKFSLARADPTRPFYLPFPLIHINKASSKRKL